MKKAFSSQAWRSKTNNWNRSNSITPSSLSFWPRPSMPSQSREQKAASLQRKVGIGAKSLDRDLGDIHTWPHSQYLVRNCNGVGGWVRLQYSCVGIGAKFAGAKSMIWWRKKLVPPCSFILQRPLALLIPLLSWPLPGSHIRSFLSSYPALLRPPLPQNCLGASRYCRLPRTLFCFQSCVGCTLEIY